MSRYSGYGFDYLDNIRDPAPLAHIRGPSYGRPASRQSREVRVRDGDNDGVSVRRVRARSRSRSRVRAAERGHAAAEVRIVSGIIADHPDRPVNDLARTATNRSTITTPVRVPDPDPDPGRAPPRADDEA
ncbi:hypothetical protein VTJ49DRAFT_3840 [Mycothermus thermophilus]|uniref:Uncharacterized protein n=1 Tax=Humicola insolens TaxID=85995 RepID=A0ABR3VQJ4_HUMIN